MTTSKSRLPIPIAICLAMGVASLQATAQEFKITSYEVIAEDHSAPIEATIGQVQQKSTGALRMAVGSFKFKQFVLISGPRASLRIGHDSPQKFAVAFSMALPKGMPTDNLVTLVNLRPLVLEKGNREYLMNDTHITVVKGKTETPGGVYGIHINITQMVDNKLHFEPIERLQPGEYAFVTQDTNAYAETTTKLYCFGVD